MRGAIVVAAVALVGCPAPKPVERAYAAPSAAEVVAALRARAEKLRSFQAETKVDHMGPKAQRVKVSMAFLVARGGKMRIEAEGPMGPLATLVSDGKDFGLVDLRNNVHLHGPADRCNVALLLGVEIEPEAVVDVLMGGAPLDGEPASVSWDPAGREILELKTPDGGRERLALDATSRRWDVLSAERYDAKNELLWRVTHEGFRDYEGGVRLPDRTFVEQPARHADARIRVLERRLNPAPRDGVFTLTPPAGIQSRFVSCP